MPGKYDSNNQSIQKINKYIGNIHVTVGYKGNILAKYLIGKKIASIVNTEDRDIVVGFLIVY